jgi:Lon protease-like protein
LPVGFVLIKNGKEALGPLAKPHFIGTSARIRKIEELENGRLRISFLGVNRFRILSVQESSGKYLEGEVKELHLVRSDRKLIEQKYLTLQAMVSSYLALVGSVLQRKISITDLPQSPSKFAYISASLLDVPSGEKQNVLISESEITLLHKVIKIYRKELALNQKLLHSKPILGEGVFSKN